jgi:EAL domain-containing protein (putative c-di-GMP-specific phosphodiesterase class I)
MFEEIAFKHTFQPIIDIDSSTIVSYEVLLRGANNEAPKFILDQVDNVKLINFEQFSRLQALDTAAMLGLECNINLNFSLESLFFEEGKYLADTLDKAKSLGFMANQLIIGVTESEFIINRDPLSHVMNEMRRKRMFMAIDDFGANYASLNMLAEIQPDMIKLDMSILRSINNHGPRKVIVKALYDFCKDLGIYIRANGIETEHEFNFLRKVGISLFQGPLFAEPGFEFLPKPSFPALI